MNFKIKLLKYIGLLWGEHGWGRSKLRRKRRRESFSTSYTRNMAKEKQKEKIKNKFQGRFISVKGTHELSCV